MHLISQLFCVLSYTRFHVFRIINRRIWSSFRRLHFGYISYIGCESDPEIFNQQIISIIRLKEFRNDNLSTHHQVEK